MSRVDAAQLPADFWAATADYLPLPDAAALAQAGRSFAFLSLSLSRPGVALVRRTWLRIRSQALNPELLRRVLQPGAVRLRSLDLQAVVDGKDVDWKCLPALPALKALSIDCVCFESQAPLYVLTDTLVARCPSLETLRLLCTAPSLEVQRSLPATLTALSVPLSTHGRPVQLSAINRCQSLTSLELTGSWRGGDVLNELALPQLSRLRVACRVPIAQPAALAAQWPQLRVVEASLFDTNTLAWMELIEGLPGPVERVVFRDHSTTVLRSLLPGADVRFSFPRVRQLELETLAMPGSTVAKEAARLADQLVRQPGNRLRIVVRDMDSSMDLD